MTSRQNNNLLGQVNHVRIHRAPLIDDKYLFSSDKETQQHGDFEEQVEIQSKLEALKQIEPYITTYVCLLVPRFEEHLLVGDLADQLHIWLKDICISFGWRLMFIDIRPEYLHWIMAVSITTYPTQFMKIVRRESSQKIFDDFPKFKQRNMSDDFWALWYFVGVGQAPYSQESIQSYIKQIRMEQGLH